jgi:RNA polymerase sigma-70 factor (ECF subfamily)
VPAGETKAPFTEPTNSVTLSAVCKGMTGQAIAMSATADRPADDTAARLGALFDTHHQRLHRLARRLSRNAEDARDLVQETFLRAARHASSVPQGADHEEPWLVRVMINIARDRWRQIEVRKRGATELAWSAEPVQSDSESALLARSIIWQALQRLAPRRRAILVLYEIEGVSIPAIARLLGVAAVTVRWHLSIGRRELAKVVDGDLKKVPGGTP